MIKTRRIKLESSDFANFRNLQQNVVITDIKLKNVWNLQFCNIKLQLYVAKKVTILQNLRFYDKHLLFYQIKFCKWVISQFLEVSSQNFMNQELHDHVRAPASGQTVDVKMQSFMSKKFQFCQSQYFMTESCRTKLKICEFVNVIISC